MYGANLSWKLLQGILNSMVAQDLIEEIVGEIRDEFDREELQTIRSFPDDTYQALGRVKVLESTFTNNRCDPVGPDVGGGALMDIGVHILDLTLWMMGNPKPTAVTGVARAELV